MLRLALIFGGRSAEHEISLASARFVADMLDPSNYVVIPVGITRSGRWRLPVDLSRALTESPWARQVYDEGRGQRQYRALRGLAACWGRILYRRWSDGAPDDVGRHPGARAPSKHRQTSQDACCLTLACDETMTHVLTLLVTGRGC